MIAAQFPGMTKEEFTQWALNQEERYEWRNGEVYAMGRTTGAHSRLTANLTSILNFEVRKRGCVLFTETVAIEWELGEDLGVYLPDVVIQCGLEKATAKGAGVVQNPNVVIEVLSKSTIDRDFGQKFQAYSAIPSVEQVIYVHQDKPVIEVRTRQGEDKWQIEIIRGLHRSFEVLGVEVRLELVYLDVEV